MIYEQAAEVGGRWILNIDGYKVYECRLSFSFDLVMERFSASPYPTAEIQIWGLFTVTRPATQPLTLDAESPDRTSLAPALALFGLTASGGEVTRDGRLVVTFTDGGTIEAHTDPKYESWAFTGSSGLKLICLAGGERAIWGPCAGDE